MEINFLKNDRPDVKVGNFVVTQGGRKLLLVQSELNKNLRVVDLEENILLEKSYKDVNDFLKNFSNKYTVYDDTQIQVNGMGLVWQ